MRTLFIDTHLWDIAIVLFENGKVVDKSTVINKKNNSEYIFPSIVNVLNDTMPDEIIVVNGPGSFTGVRLGVTIAKTFAYTLNIPIKTISSLECLAISSGNQNVAISDGNGYFIGIFGDGYKLKKEYYYIDLEQFEIENQALNFTIESSINYEAIYSFVQNNKNAENPHGVKPIYVKKIGVEK